MEILKIKLVHEFFLIFSNYSSLIKEDLTNQQIPFGICLALNSNRLKLQTHTFIAL